MRLLFENLRMPNRLLDTLLYMSEISRRFETNDLIPILMIEGYA